MFEAPTAVSGESTKKPKSEIPHIAVVEVLACCETVFPSILHLIVFVDAVLLEARNVCIVTLSPTVRTGGREIESYVTSEVNAAPALTDSLVKSAELGAEKVSASADVREKPEYQPAASDGLPG